MAESGQQRNTERTGSWAVMWNAGCLDQMAAKQVADDVRLQFENDLGRVCDIRKEVCNQESRGKCDPVLLTWAMPTGRKDSEERPSKDNDYEPNVCVLPKVNVLAVGDGARGM